MSVRLLEWLQRSTWKAELPATASTCSARRPRTAPVRSPLKLLSATLLAPSNMRPTYALLARTCMVPPHRELAAYCIIEGQCSRVGLSFYTPCVISLAIIDSPVMQFRSPAC